MEEDVQKQIEARLAELPADVQNAIGSSDLEAKLNAIGAKHQLHIDQIGYLQDETLLVMLGFADPTEFAPQLESNLKVPKAIAETLAREVTEEIFVPIRESMKTFTESQSRLEGTAASLEGAPKSLDLKAESYSADTMLAEKTVTRPASVPPPKTPPPMPALYKADPYREPPDSF